MKGWTIAEERALRELAHFGAEACAFFFDRSVDSIEIKARRLGVSLKVREQSFTDGKLTEALCNRVRQWEEHTLCPGCGKRQATVVRTGLCGVCHRDRLTQAHLDQLAEHEAQQRLWQARQQLKRAREADPA